MSDYINREETIKALRLYAEQKHCGGETVLANGILKAVCFIEKKENIPTLDETEIIRKAFDRVLERLEEIKKNLVVNANSDYLAIHYALAIDSTIKVVKEEGGVE